jgi:hypothetical protein
MSGRWWTHSAGPDVLLYAVSLGYIALAPYTKVEESFNVQACHDLLEHGWQRLSLFDHLVFSGVVPRTFIGPVLLTLPLRPIYWLLRHGAGLQPMVGLYLGAYLTARTGPRALMCARIVFRARIRCLVDLRVRALSGVHACSACLLGPVECRGIEPLATASRWLLCPLAALFVGICSIARHTISSAVLLIAPLAQHVCFAAVYVCFCAFITALSHGVVHGCGSSQFLALCSLGKFTTD